jgi:hypothetical protein
MIKTPYSIGDRVWDKSLKRYDVIEEINIHITKNRESIKYKMSNHTSWEYESMIGKEEGCSCPPKYNDGRPFDGVSYGCPLHGR